MAVEPPTASPSYDPSCDEERNVWRKRKDKGSGYVNQRNGEDHFPSSEPVGNVAAQPRTHNGTNEQ